MESEAISNAFLRAISIIMISSKSPPMEPGRMSRTPAISKAARHLAHR
jgi:hypothetical protein